MSMPLHRVSSLRRWPQSHAPAAQYWSRRLSSPRRGSRLVESTVQGVPGAEPAMHRVALLYIQDKQTVEQVIAPGAARRYAPADGSSTRGGSTSVRGRVRSPHMAKLQAVCVPIAQDS